MEPNLSIQEIAQRSVSRVQNTPPEQWGELMRQVLEALEAHARETGQMDAYDAALQQVQQHLERRVMERQDIAPTT